MHAEEEKVKVTEEQAYAPITYGDGSTIDIQDRTLLNLSLAHESRSCMDASRLTVCSDFYGVSAY